MPESTESRRYVVCLNNEGYQASLVVRRIYDTIPGLEAGKREFARVIDESGEDYLYPSSLFESIEPPAGPRRKIADAV
jgi:hypothetical protein